MASLNDAIEIFAGNKATFRYTVVDQDNGGAVFNLTGYTLRWTLSAYDESGNYKTTPSLEKKSASAGHMTITAASGLVDVNVKTADTAALTPGDYYAELEIVDGSSEALVVAYGDVAVRANVTNT